MKLPYRVGFKAMIAMDPGRKDPQQTVVSDFFISFLTRMMESSNSIDPIFADFFTQNTI